MRSLCLIFLLIPPLIPTELHAQEVPLHQASNEKTGSRAVDKNVFWLVAGIQAVGYTSALVALNQAWYKDHPRTSLHFHNDMGDWLQTDKMGHINTTYHLNRLSAGAFRLSGMGRRKTAWMGAASALGFMTVIEMLDGLSAEWGFSVGDQVANTIGSASYVAQELLWEEQRFGWKFSFHRTGLARQRPDLFGSSLAEQVIKDYNGMGFWLSMNIHSFFNHWEGFPAWLNIAAGYGAYGMLGGSENPTHHQGEELPHLERYRRWFISPDIDFARIPVKSPFLGGLFASLNFIKFPAPAIEYNSMHGLSFHLVYF
ncbi:MAG: DUF2279 domain-containing protein [Bacteroidales bacterium]